MTDDSDLLELATDSRQATARPKIPAAKIHVLGLAPLKEKLGSKWDRLSGLVHKLFETAIARVQGPSDHFLKLNELSYAVTFHDLSLEATNLACVSVAREVCQLLFGNQVDEISVRSIVAAIAESAFVEHANAIDMIDKIIEQHGTETVVTQSVQSGSIEPVIAIAGQVPKPALSLLKQIEKAHALVSPLGLKLGFFPVWELHKGESNSLFLAPFRWKANQVTVSGRRALDSASEKQIGEIEIALLGAAAAYAERICDVEKVCAVGVGVSYETLSSFQSRIRYVTALQKIKPPSSSPILLKIEQVPSGVPLARIAELVAMLKTPNVRFTAEFVPLPAIPQINIRLGAIGVGGALTPGIDLESAAKVVERLARQIAGQKLFTFLDRLDTDELLDIASQYGVRFGTGAFLGMGHYTGLEEVPSFPLTLATSRSNPPFRNKLADH
ncbi:MAG: hypothetical protein HY243_13155 [Proteobacteria bacterium]|nr:hypothetical protein [Pseudomonadota bacterium]